MAQLPGAQLEPPRCRRLLIVQHNAFVARSLARHFRSFFDRVELAYTPDEAEAILDEPLRSPTHLLCGERFGPGYEAGSQLIPHWRARYAGIQQVVLLTTETDLPPVLGGVDLVVHKPADPEQLASLLCGT
jgi:hypothetical protein